MKYQASLSPSLRSGITTRRIMLDVVLALLPSGVIAVWRYGFDVLLTVAVSVGVCIACEALFAAARRKPAETSDGSAVVTGLLIAYNLPPDAPFWMALVAGVFAIIVVKALFGGLGHNFVNPALAARALLLASWPMLMTSFPVPGLDAVASATPLAALASSSAPAATYLDLLLGGAPGCIGEVGRAGLLLGGIFLIFRGVVDWRIPVAYLGGSAVCSLLAGWLAPDFAAPGTMGDPLYYLLSGGLMLGAFFMATDYVTSPATPWGRAVFGLGCALVTFVIRAFGGYPEGVTYAILLMNVASPLIERTTMPRVYGHKRREAKAS